jgi:hypothetical protein
MWNLKILTYISGHKITIIIIVVVIILLFLFIIHLVCSLN